MSGRYYIKTYGCQMNEYDSARMADVLQGMAGLSQTEDPEAADVLLVNTCSVREKAQEKVFSLLGEWRGYKQQRPGVIIGVGGCVASQEGEGITARAPYVDLVFGPQTIHRLPDMITELRRRGRPVVDVSFPEIEKFDRMPEPRADGASAFVSIMEGCSKYCSFCVVPYTRGDEVSRPFASVLDEVRVLGRQGVMEITLLGQNVNAYAGEMHDGARVDLATLIHHVAAIDGIERIRFTTSHPLEFSDSLIEAYAAVPALANHLHLPVQSGSDRVLSAMKRGYTALQFKERIRRLRAVRPGISVSSDFIVGFPGETAAAFDTLLAFIRETKFERLGIFSYSKEDGTIAGKMSSQLTDKAKQRRRELAMAAQHEVARAVSERFVGRTLKVLIESEASAKELQAAKISSWEHGLIRETDKHAAQLKGRYLVARGEADAPDIDGRVYVRGKLPLGGFARVRVVGHTDYDLIAEPV